MARPRPSPAKSRSLGSLTPAPSTFSRLSAGMPGPLSSTESSNIGDGASTRRTATATAPPSGVYLKAFPTRFSTARESARRSPVTTSSPSAETVTRRPRAAAWASKRPTMERASAPRSKAAAGSTGASALARRSSMAPASTPTSTMRWACARWTSFTGPSRPSRRFAASPTRSPRALRRSCSSASVASTRITPASAGSPCARTCPRSCGRGGSPRARGAATPRAPAGSRSSTRGRRT